MTIGRLLATTLLVSLVAASSPPVGGQSGGDRPRTIDEFLKLGDRPRVIAHRGFSGVAPENTLVAFRRAIELGADMIELDVLLSRDGEVVVIHDDTVDRTTNTQGTVASMPLAELRRLDAGSWFSQEFAGAPIPTLAEVLDLARGKILVNVEIKTEAVTDESRGGIAEKVIEFINERRMRDVAIISSFDPRALRQVAALDPRIKTASLFNKELHAGKGPMEVMGEVGSVAFNISKQLLRPDVVRQCHENGRPVAVYTVNEPAEMRKLIELGVDALFTDRPDLLLELLD